MKFLTNQLLIHEIERLSASIHADCERLQLGAVNWICPILLCPYPRILNNINPMLQSSKLIAQGKGLASALLKRASTVELDWDVRQKSRFETTDSAGRQLGIFLPRGTVARGGDVLVAQDGSLIKVLAAAQTVLKITHCTIHGAAFDLIRAAYHLGNRHVPIELKPDHLKIEPDHVLADMLRAMHLIVSEVNEPFEPENGAYATGGHFGGHRHHHDEEQVHVHGPGCSHQH